MNYDYDPLYRLKQELVVDGTATGQAVGYELDTLGNRLSRSGGTFGAALPSQSDGTFDRSGKLLAYNGQQFQYDANMNMKTSLLVGGAIAGEDSYDYEDHLIARTPTSGAAISILYDAEGNKVKRTVADAAVYYLVDNQNPTGYAQVLEERTTSGSGQLQLKNRFTYGSSLVSQSDANGLKWYYGVDGHGNVRYLVDGQGNKLAAYDYDAFGIQTRSDGTLATSNTRLYCAEEFDKDLGFYYLRARFYNPQISRFTSVDSYEGNTEDPLTLHKYLYCAADPVSSVDRSGHETTIMGMSAATFVGSTLHGWHDTVVTSAGSAMQHTIFGVQARKSMNEVLLGYATEVLESAALAYLGGKLFAKLEDIQFGGGLFKGKPPMCFVGDTAVAAETGLKRIDEIREGDYVWSWNEDTQTTNLRKVVATQSHVVDHAVRLVVSGTSIETTDEHPFWVAGKGWTRAANLSVGVGLITFSGQTNLLEQFSVITNEVRVFNFEVQGGHTYFVSDNRVLVHNACAWATRSAALPEKSGVYIIELKGKVYVGKARDVYDRLVKQKHPHSLIAQHPDAQIAVVEVDVSHIKSVSDQDRALKVIETDLINSMGSMKPTGLNGVIPLTPAKRELYREKLKPVVIDYQEY